MALSPAEKMLYSATRISTYKNGSLSSYGTGFFYQIEYPGGLSTVMLITNKHVLEGADRIDLSLPVKGADGLPTNTFRVWQLTMVGPAIQHPDNSVDLAAISVTGLHGMSAEVVSEEPFYVALRRDMLPDASVWASLDAIEDVTMVGCPNGLFDEANNLPIVRRGVTATHPGKNYQGREEFMVDLACFPGSSGSPVFLYSTGATYDREAGSFALGNIRLRLLGVLYAGPTINQRGQIVLTHQPSVSIASMMHLGIVIKAQQILAFERIARQQLGFE